MNLIVWILLLFSCASCGLGEYFSKLWANSENKLHLFLVIFFYFIGVCLWLYALKQYNMLSVVGLAWSLLTVLITVFLGIFLFNEKMSYYQMIGCFLSLISLILLSL